jgi:MoaA/NifB/PqqE/SkfB family radical SAM enzyme
MNATRTVSFAKSSANIFFHILTQCNLHCRHCYINKKQHGVSSLPLPVINTWLEVFAEKHENANIIFLGGEPTLHPDLSSAVKKANNLGFGSITIDTNGYLFNDILSKVIPEEVDFFSFSLDGATRQTNDLIRGKGSYDICIKGIRETVSRGFSTSLIYTVSNDNLHELEMMIPLLENLEVDRFFIQVIGLRGKSAKEGAGLQVSKDDWEKKIPEVAEKVAGFGITATFPKVFLNNEESFECAGLVADNYFIFPNGRVYQCPICEDFPLHSMAFEENRIVETAGINEKDLFCLSIPEGCVMNKLIQPENLRYNQDGTPSYKVACCMLKEERSVL